MTECYTQAGASYNFSLNSERWLLSALRKRVKPSPAFVTNYSRTHGFMFWLDARKRRKTCKISSPRLRRRQREIEFFVTIPHPGGKAAWPKDHTRAMRHIFDCLVLMLGKLELDATQLKKDIPALLKDYSTRSASRMTYKDWDED